MDNGNSPARGGVAAAALGGVVLCIGVLTVWQAGVNRGLQQELAGNQEKLAKAQTIANLDNNLVQLLAKAAVENNDTAIRNLLSANGVTLNQGPAPQQSQALAPAQAPIQASANGQ
ncbi:MAG: hypothetical protein K2P79_01950 [Sphingomonas sp.]|nr:hypothetical protein [Sphingomonas sp.]